MFKYIEQLQKKPEGYRRRFAFGVSASTTLVLLFIWLSVTLYTTSSSTAVVTEKSGSSLSPLENLRASALDGLLKLKTQFDSAKQKLNFISDEYQKAAGTSTDEVAVDEASTTPASGETSATTSASATGTSAY